MAEPKVFSVRQAAVAGMFYPADPGQCGTLAQELTKLPEKTAPVAAAVGGVVPHAGWICSGAIAGQTLGMLASAPTPDVVVVFGAVHTPIAVFSAVLASYSLWKTPGGDIEVAAGASRALGRVSNLFVTDDRFHEREHAVEVELPLIRAVWPDARVLPVEIPAVDAAVEMGLQTARVVLDSGLRAVFLASSDLTHYGPAYGFAPAGVGLAGLNWAKENDRRLLRLIENYDLDAIVPEVREHLNACGGGAIAAMLAACQEAGATRAKVITHASSFETLARVAPQPPVDAVGYASVVAA